MLLNERIASAPKPFNAILTRRKKLGRRQTRQRAVLRNAQWSNSQRCSALMARLREKLFSKAPAICRRSWRARRLLPAGFTKLLVNGCALPRSAWSITYITLIAWEIAAISMIAWHSRPKLFAIICRHFLKVLNEYPNDPHELP